MQKKKWQPVDARKFGNHMIVRSPVFPCYDYTDAENRERARAKDKTKKEKKGDEVHCGKKKKNLKNSKL